MGDGMRPAAKADDRFHAVTLEAAHPHPEARSGLGLSSGQIPDFSVKENDAMRNMLKTTTTGLVMVAITGLAGCATTSDLDALRAEVQKTNATANQAAADAASAKKDAAAARTAAEQARDTAQDTNEKLDRMFKKSMYK
jgi:murein lipoprotein